MNCPTDQTQLQEQCVEGFVAHRCQRCHGVFIPSDFFREIKAQAALQVHRQFVDRLHNLHPQARHCPNRCGTMSTMCTKGIEIDVCFQCNGLWLDRGELEKLILQFGSPRKHDLEKCGNSLTTMDSEKKSSKLDVVDAIDVIDLASGLFNLFN